MYFHATYASIDKNNKHGEIIGMFQKYPLKPLNLSSTSIVVNRYINKKGARLR